MAFGPSIGSWTPAELRRFVVNLLEDPGALPKSVSGPTQKLPSGAADGDVPVWDAASNAWTTSTIHPVPAKELANYPADAGQGLLGDGTWTNVMRLAATGSLSGAAASLTLTLPSVTYQGLRAVLVCKSNVNASSGIDVRPNNQQAASNYFYSEISWQAAGSVVAAQNPDGQTMFRCGVVNDNTNTMVGLLDMPNAGTSDSTKFMTANFTRAGGTLSRITNGYQSDGGGTPTSTLVFLQQAANNFAAGTYAKAWIY